MRDEYTCWRFMERIAAMQVARLVAPKIARINIRAGHCHSVNFPRCWLYRVRKEEGGVALVPAEQRVDGGKKHRYPYQPPSPRLLDGILCASRFQRNAHVVRGRIFVASTPLLSSFSRGSPLYARHLDAATGNTTDKPIHTYVRKYTHAHVYIYIYEYTVRVRAN